MNTKPIWLTEDLGRLVRVMVFFRVGSRLARVCRVVDKIQLGLMVYPNALIHTTIQSLQEDMKEFEQGVKQAFVESKH